MKKNFFWISIAVFLLAFVVAGFWLVRFLVSANGRALVAREVVTHILTTNTQEANYVQEALGFTSPQTYLVLLLNNTELRPGGGFIGAYAIVRFDKGAPDIIKAEGTEILDNYAPTAFSTPPAPLQKYLGTTKWQFRDSNWSPDFPTSASTSLAMYAAEHGVDAEQIDGVIGFTPTVVENILKITGPITVAGQTYTSDTFTKQLEYQVEYAYASEGISTKNRKQMLGELAQALLPRLVTTGVTHWADYAALLPRMFAEKQLIFYSVHPKLEAALEANNLNGSMEGAPEDYLLWVDANLGALKTDASITRHLTYDLAPEGNGYVATATMQFVHSGTFDWRTTRYRDYARVFVPIGSQFLSVSGSMATDKSPLPGVVDQGVENGRQWFGTFFSLEPGQAHTLSFHYRLPPTLSTEMAAASLYTLRVQKQLGTLAPQLTVHLDFGTKGVASTSPSGVITPSTHSVVFSSSLLTDRTFAVGFSQ